MVASRFLHTMSHYKSPPGAVELPVPPAATERRRRARAAGDPGTALPGGCDQWENFPRILVGGIPTTDINQLGSWDDEITYIYIYTHSIYIYIHTHIYIYINILCVYIYIWKNRNCSKPPTGFRIPRRVVGIYWK